MNIDELRKQPHLSASSINDFIECGLQWKFGRIDKIPHEYTAATLLFGSAIHNVLEEFNQAKLNGHDKSLDDIHSSFASHFQHKIQQSDKVGFKDGDDVESLVQKELSSHPAIRRLIMFRFWIGCMSRAMTMTPRCNVPWMTNSSC